MKDEKKFFMSSLQLKADYRDLKLSSHNSLLFASSLAYDFPV